MTTTARNAWLFEWWFGWVPLQARQGPLTSSLRLCRFGFFTADIAPCLQATRLRWFMHCAASASIAHAVRVLRASTATGSNSMLLGQSWAKARNTGVTLTSWPLLACRWQPPLALPTWSSPPKHCSTVLRGRSVPVQRKRRHPKKPISGVTTQNNRVLASNRVATRRKAIYFDNSTIEVHCHASSTSKRSAWMVYSNRTLTQWVLILAM